MTMMLGKSGYTKSLSKLAHIHRISSVPDREPANSVKIATQDFTSCKYTNEQKLKNMELLLVYGNSQERKTITQHWKDSIYRADLSREDRVTLSNMAGLINDMKGVDAELLTF